MPSNYKRLLVNKDIWLFCGQSGTGKLSLYRFVNITKIATNRPYQQFYAFVNSFITVITTVSVYSHNRKAYY